jgi:putative monooxygenase
MQTETVRIKSVNDIPADRRRGGEIRTLLSPKTVASTSGFMGVATIAAGEKINEHYHPYSEEFVYVVSGSIVAQLNDVPYPVQAGQGLFIPIGVRHRLVNAGDQEAFLVFHLGPLAPRPDMGHVDTE